MSKKNKKNKICLISSSGGHFEQLLMLRKLANDNNDIFIVTEKTKYNKKDKKIKYFVKQVNRKELLFIPKMIMILFKSLYIIIKERPNVIISTGVLAAIPMLFFGHLFRKKVIYIESFAKISSPTMTGKLIYRKKWANQFYVQWEPMLEFYYILKREKEIDALSLQKLLYFISGFSKVFSSVSNIISDNSESWAYGPVYREIYEAFSYYGCDKIDYGELVKDREYNLSVEEKKFIDSIIEAFGFYSGSILSEMTHMTDPWIESRKGLKDGEFSNRVIDNESIEKYFKKVCEDYDIRNYSDIKKYSEAMFEKSKNNLLH